MDAVWLEGGELSVREAEIPQLPEGEALVRVLQAGICNTDLELVAGYYPFRGILGHEFVGHVEEGPKALRGARVVGEINAVCGECTQCTAGRSSHCLRRTVLGIKDRDGAFARFLTLPVANLHKVPDGIPNDAATLIEPLAAALRIQQQVPVGPGVRVLVVGTGKLGQLIARTLSLVGCDLVALGRRPATLEMLRRQGLRTLQGSELEERSFDVAVECTGNADGFDLARRALRPRGTLVLKSTYRGSLTLDAAPLVVDEITLLGSRCGPFAPAIDLLAQRELDLEDLIEARYPLAEALGAFEHAARPGALKVLLQMD